MWQLFDISFGVLATGCIMYNLKLLYLGNGEPKPKSPKNEAVDENPMKSNTDYVKHPILKDDDVEPIKPMGNLDQYSNVYSKWKENQPNSLSKGEEHSEPNLECEEPKQESPKNEAEDENPIIKSNTEYLKHPILNDDVARKYILETAVPIKPIGNLDQFSNVYPKWKENQPSILSKGEEHSEPNLECEEPKQESPKNEAEDENPIIKSNTEYLKHPILDDDVARKYILETAVPIKPIGNLDQFSNVYPKCKENQSNILSRGEEHSEPNLECEEPKQESPKNEAVDENPIIKSNTDYLKHPILNDDVALKCILETGVPTVSLGQYSNVYPQRKENQTTNQEPISPKNEAEDESTIPKADFVHIMGLKISKNHLNIFPYCQQMCAKWIKNHTSILNKENQQSKPKLAEEATKKYGHHYRSTTFRESGSR